uniref:5'-nucleotidase domain-containing protein 4 n=1 Tax=Globodera pallida TaxID=36090 RepID=A0A183BKS1_GLOPA
MNSSTTSNDKNVPSDLQKQISIIYKREPEKRIFVNRTVRLEKIQFFGFDMDYTLAVYKSPTMEAETFKLVVKYLIQIGYPSEIADIEYDPMFSIRGLWFDIQYGNLLKVDGFGNILRASHGRRFLLWKEIEDFYPNKFIQLSERRIYVLNTLFNLPDAYLITRLVDFFDKYEKTPDKTGVRYGDVIMSYNAIFQDIRNAMDYVHGEISVGQLKHKILERIADFVEIDDRIGLMLSQLRALGRKTFLLTNSDYEYTKAVMTYLLGSEWRTFFDMIIVSACKPLWFAEGTVFREVDTETGALKIGVPTDPLKKTGAVYSGGSCDAFRRLVKVRGKNVLYIGDHIFGDVLRSKKTKGWRTFLVVPELSRELAVWTGKRELFERLQQFESQLADLYRHSDANTLDKPSDAVVGNVLKAIQEVTQARDQQYGVFGSLFRRRAWSQQMSKAPTGSMEEEEEESGTAGAGSCSTGNASTPTNASSSRPEEGGVDTDESNEDLLTNNGGGGSGVSISGITRPRAGTTDQLTNDVVVPKQAYVEGSNQQ